MANSSNKKKKQTSNKNTVKNRKPASGKKNVSARNNKTIRKNAASAKALTPEMEKKRLEREQFFARVRGNVFYRYLYGQGWLYFVLSFVISASIMLYAFAQEGIHPFGNNQMLVVDLWHQYFPFFRVEREKLLTGGSLLYSWQNGLGSNFISLMAYYAASPLNWISILFSEDGVRDAMMYILVMKIGFAGAFFQRFLRYTYNRNDFSTCVFSVMYALCSFNLGYYWNVMWFDTVAIFPLVMLGIVAICRERKWKTFTFSLAIALISNYYIGYFVCIFSVFMFLAASIIEFKSIKDWLVKFWIMLRSALLGGAMSAFMLIPAYCGLKLSYSNDERSVFQKLKDILSGDFKKYESWTSIFANTISYNEPTKVEGLPNFACGMLAIVLIGVFLFSKGIKIREKVSSTIMLAIIAVSCNLRPLNYIWHGFHFTNQIPYRFAFIFSFVLAAAAYRAYAIMLKNGIKYYQLVLMLIGPATVFYLNYYVKKDDFKIEGAIKSSLIITIAYLLIFTAAKVFPFRNKAVRNTIMSFALAIAVFSEFVSVAKTGVKTVGSSSYTSYPTSYDEVESLLSAAKESEDSLFYRTEVTDTYTLNDSALYGYYGISQFSSVANVSVTRLCKRLGMYASEAGNRYYYRINTPVVNALFGVKYMIKKGSPLETEGYALEYAGSAGKSGTCYLYKNKYNLSLGFMVDKDILRVEDKEALNPFEYQNSVMKFATGSSKPTFLAQVVSLAEYTNMSVTKNGYGNYNFTRPDKDSTNSYTEYTFECNDDMPLYAYASCNDSCDKIQVRYDGKVVDSGNLIKKYPVVFPAGDGVSGKQSVIQINSDSEHNSGNFKLMVYALDLKAFEEQYAQLADEQFQITDFADSRIEGNIKAKKDGVLYFSIPYEKGWTVYVDGEKAETFDVLNSMLGVEVSKGEHEIKLVYCPEGFKLGTAISVSAFVITCGLIWYDRRRRKKKLPVEKQPESGEGPDNVPEKEEPAEEKVIHTGEIYNQEVEEISAAASEPVEPEKNEAAEITAEPEIKAQTEAPAENAENDAENPVSGEENEKSQSDDSLQGN